MPYGKFIAPARMPPPANGLANWRRHMKKMIALLVLILMVPTLIGCEAQGKVKTDDDSVKVKAKVEEK